MMRNVGVVVVCGLAGLASAQSWRTSYEAGLDQLRQGKYVEARISFGMAARDKADSAGPILLPGSIMDRRTWRNGAAYSPTLLAAYCSLSAAVSTSGDGRSLLAREAGLDLLRLLDSGKASIAAFVLLERAASLEGDQADLQAVRERFQTEGGRARFRVDLEALSPEDQLLLAGIKPPAIGKAPVKPEPKQEAENLNTVLLASQPVDTKPSTLEPANVQPEAVPPTPTPVIPASQPTTPQATGDVAPILVSMPAKSEPLNGTGTPIVPSGAGAEVAPIAPMVPRGPQKYALIIGNALSSMPEAELPFAADDAMKIRDSLMAFAGYPMENIELVVNASAVQMAATINAMAERVPENATVLIYFTGMGANIGGRDFLAGIDTEFASQAAAMIPKADVYRAFAKKGAVVFAFFQSPRPVREGRYFGSEMPSMGRVSQVQATIPGATVHSLVRDGKSTGLFTDAFVSVLSDVKSDKVPILEFGWLLFNQIRRGNTGTTGGGSPQTPTLPVLTNLASDARF